RRRRFSRAWAPHPDWLRSEIRVGQNRKPAPAAHLPTGSQSARGALPGTSTPSQLRIPKSLSPDGASGSVPMRTFHTADEGRSIFLADLLFCPRSDLCCLFRVLPFAGGPGDPARTFAAGAPIRPVSSGHVRVPGDPVRAGRRNRATRVLH